MTEIEETQARVRALAEKLRERITQCYEIGPLSYTSTTQLLALVDELDALFASPLVPSQPAQEDKFKVYFEAYVMGSKWPAGKSFAVFAREIWDYLQANKPNGPPCGHLTPMCDIGAGSCAACSVFDWSAPSAPDTPLVEASSQEKP